MITSSDRTTDSLRLFINSFQTRESVNKCFCSFCAKAGIPKNECYVAEKEIGGVDSSTGEIVCKYCLDLIAKIRGIK
jgi:hypothetical protein